MLVLCCMLLMMKGSCMAPHGAATLLAPLVLAMLTLAMLTGPELVLAMLTLALLLLRCMSLGGGCMASLLACSVAVMETVCAVMSACCLWLLLITKRASSSCMLSWSFSCCSWWLSCSSWLTTFFSWLLTVASRIFPSMSSRLCALMWMSALASEYCLESTLRAGEPPHFIVGSKRRNWAAGGKKGVRGDQKLRKQYI